MSIGKTQFLQATLIGGKSVQILNAPIEGWFWLTLQRVTSGAVIITSADGQTSGMPIGSTPITIPISPGTQVWAYSPTDDEVGYSVCPMPSGMVESFTGLAQFLQKILAPQTIRGTAPIKRSLNEELENIKRRGI